MKLFWFIAGASVAATFIVTAWRQARLSNRIRPYTKTTVEIVKEGPLLTPNERPIGFGQFEIIDSKYAVGLDLERDEDAAELMRRTDGGWEAAAQK